jgi:mono/diheme cytochrome c family protein
MLTRSPFRRVQALLCLLIWSTFCVSLNAQVDFNRQVRPILAEHCLQCHGPDAEKRSADLRLDVEADAKKSVIVAGSVDDSELLHRIQSTDPETVMPPPATGKVLTEVQKEILRRWIQEGAKYSGHWAFQPIADSESLLKALPASEGNVNPIDRFLLHKLQQSGLQYSKPVSRTPFIRRATFDLTGLPPTWAEVEAFENDTAPSSEARLSIGCWNHLDTANGGDATGWTSLAMLTHTAARR